MKIGIFTEVYKPIINGVVNSIIGFREGLTELGHEVYVFCPTYKDTKPEDDMIIYCKSWPLPGKSGYHFIFPLDKKIKHIARDMDVIHVQHPFVMGDIAADTAKEFDIPIAFTNHTQYDQYLHYVPFSKKFVKKQLVEYIKNFTKRVDLIVAPAKGIEDKLRGYGVKTPINIVPNGIDVERFSKKIPNEAKNIILSRYGFEKSDQILVFTGRIADEKNLSFLLRAFKKIKQSNKKTKLLMVGGGVQIDKFRHMIQDMDLTNDAIITDFIPYEKMQDYLSIAKIYVTASKSEVHPLTILEGLAEGLPMVIVDAPGTGDIVTNEIDGLVVKDDIDDFTKKTLKLLENKKLYDRLSEGAKKTASKYSFLSTSKTMLKAYDRTIEIHNKEK